jgi:hypothetical protein
MNEFEKLFKGHKMYVGENKNGETVIASTMHPGVTTTFKNKKKPPQLPPVIYLPPPDEK